MRYEALRRWFILTFLLLLFFIGAFAYVMLIKPGLQGFVIQKQLEARDLVLVGILDQIQKQGYIEIGLGDGKSLVLVPYNSNQQGGAQQPPAIQPTQQTSTAIK